MERIVVRPNGPLEGRVRASGAKNSVLKLMAATVLAEGTFVLRNVPALEDTKGESGKVLTLREQMTLHRANPTCAGCHRLMDPLGFPFELYDGIGRARANLAEISTAGKLDGTAAPAEFTDLRGLVQVLLAAPEVHRCWAQQWMQRALGAQRAEDGELDRLAAEAAAGMPWADMMVEIVLSPAFSRVQHPHPG